MQSFSVDRAWSLRSSISNKLPGDTGAAGPGTPPPTPTSHLSDLLYNVRAAFWLSSPQQTSKIPRLSRCSTQKAVQRSYTRLRKILQEAHLSWYLVSKAPYLFVNFHLPSQSNLTLRSVSSCRSSAMTSAFSSPSLNSCLRFPGN